MIENPQNYGLDEFPDVIIKVGMFNEKLYSELEETYIEELERRDQDPSEEYDVVESSARNYFSPANAAERRSMDVDAE